MIHSYFTPFKTTTTTTMNISNNLANTPSISSSSSSQSQSHSASASAPSSSILSTPLSTPKVISAKKENLRKLGYRDLQHWLENKNHIYIGRDMSRFVDGAKGSKWQNPFRPQQYASVEERISRFEEYLMKNKELLKDIEELRGKDLACWCKNKGNEPCHGDVLLKLANASTQNININNNSTNTSTSANTNTSFKPYSGIRSTIHVNTPKFTEDDFPPLKKLCQK
jgi:hypothetical protein